MSHRETKLRARTRLVGIPKAVCIIMILNTNIHNSSKYEYSRVCIVQQQSNNTLAHIMHTLEVVLEYAYNNNQRQVCPQTASVFAY